MVSLKNALEEALKNPHEEQTKALFSEGSYRGLKDEEITFLQNNHWQVYEGKIRQVLTAPTGHLFLVHSDRLSAFDRLIGYVPFKGAILSLLSTHWLRELKPLVPHYFLNSPHPRVICGAALTSIKLEVVVRNYLAGNLQREYMAGQRHYCGVPLPEGLKPFGKLPTAILTPTTKAAPFEHDRNISPEEAVELGLVTEEQWSQIQELSLKIFTFGAERLLNKGWILVDTKYEFGLTPEGEVALIDEVHTPDSSRFWRASSYHSCLQAGRSPEMFDKENIRRYLLERGFSGLGEVPAVPQEEFLKLALAYIEIVESCTGAILQVEELRRPVTVELLSNWSIKAVPFS